MTNEHRDQLHARGVLAVNGAAGVYRCENEACLTVWRSMKDAPRCPRGCRFRDTGLVINMVADRPILAGVTARFLKWIDLFVENAGGEWAADDPALFLLYGFDSAYLSPLIFERNGRLLVDQEQFLWRVADVLGVDTGTATKTWQRKETRRVRLAGVVRKAVVDHLRDARPS